MASLALPRQPKTGFRRPMVFSDGICEIDYVYPRGIHLRVGNEWWIYSCTIDATVINVAHPDHDHLKDVWPNVSAA